MSKSVVVCLLTWALALGVLVPRGSAAPALGAKPVRYEYAELYSTRVAAGPAAPMLPAPAAVRTVIRWTTGAKRSR